jgi:hypothetical protein
MKTTVKCANCGNTLHEGDEGVPSNLPRCTRCGSPLQEVSVGFEDEAHAYELWKLKAKETGFKKPTLERVAGDELFRKTNTWHRIARLVDRKNDQYYELVTNPATGEVIRECEEPLSHHIGRGSAKFQDHRFPHEELAYGAFCIYEEEKRLGKCSGQDAHWYMAIERLKRDRAGVPQTPS